MTNKKNENKVLPEGKSAYPMHPGDAPFKALERLLDIERLPDKREAVREVKSQAARQLRMLEEMHRDLVRRAKEVVEKAHEDLRLHDIPIHARKDRNSTYYLYRYDSRESFFSILPPDDYLSADPDAEFIGSYQLNEDSSWTKLS